MEQAPVHFGAAGSPLTGWSGGAGLALALPMTQPTRAHEELRQLAAASFKPWSSAKHLKPAAPELIRAGTPGGLPFDVFTTDVVSGCLPPAQICFGNCFAARSAYLGGIDFGRRVPNLLDEAVLERDLSQLPVEQGYVCNGWNSDPSWDWEKIICITQLIRAAGKHPVLISKIFVSPTAEQMRALAASGTEIRTCLSAFDSDRQEQQRFDFMEQYRAAKGLAVAIVMSALFKDPSLRQRQDRLVEGLERRDLPASENSLRVDPGNSVIAAIDVENCRPVPGAPGELWAGRLYPVRVPVPARFCTPFTYRGGIAPFASKNDPAFLAALNVEPIPTHEQVLAESGIPKPRSAGVPKTYRVA